MSTVKGERKLKPSEARALERRQEQQEAEARIDLDTPPPLPEVVGEDLELGAMIEADPILSTQIIDLAAKCRSASELDKWKKEEGSPLLLALMDALSAKSIDGSQVGSVQLDADGMHVVDTMWKATKRRGSNTILSAHKLMEAGVDPELINRCYETKYYYFVEVRKVKPSKGGK